jgi:transketolase
VEQKSQVEYFGRTLVEQGEIYPDIVALDADVSASTKTSYFQDRFPDRFIQVGISEQDLIGISAGLALSGKRPVPAAFTNFIIGRGWEQIYNSVARQKLNVLIVGTHSGLSPAADGESHQCISDIALMRVLPNMRVVVPADASAAATSTKSLLRSNGPSYLRLVRGAVPVVYPDNYELNIGKAEIIKEGSDVTIVATGHMVSVSIGAADTLKERGISAKVIDMHTIKPLDKEALTLAAHETGAIVTVEEHNIIGGLGGAVAEYLSEENPVPVLKIGIRDRFGQSSRSYHALLEEYGLTSETVVKAAESLQNRR